MIFLVPFTIVSNLVGAQCILLSVPSCRISGKTLKHFHSGLLIIGETLAEDLILVIKGYSMHRLFCAVCHKLSFSSILRGANCVISDNFQLLSKDPI